jgi:hypothetical protein
MPEYRAEFLTHGNRVFGIAYYHAAHDGAAISHANSVLRANFGIGHQIWQNDRLVYQETYSDDA